MPVIQPIMNVAERTLFSAHRHKITHDIRDVLVIRTLKYLSKNEITKKTFTDFVRSLTWQNFKGFVGDVVGLRFTKEMFKFGNNLRKKTTRVCLQTPNRLAGYGYNRIIELFKPRVR